MHSHSRRQLILESGCSHQVAVFPLCQCPLFLHLFLLLQLCMASRQTGQKFFWFIFWLQASLHHQLLNVLISLFKLSQAVQAKQKNACLLAGFCQVFASPVYYIVRWSKSMQYEGSWATKTIIFEDVRGHKMTPIFHVQIPLGMFIGENYPEFALVDRATK